MKMRLCSLFLAAMLAVPVVTGCQAGQRVKSVGRAVEQGAQSIADTLAAETTAAAAPDKPADHTLTLEEAQSIALKHAGFSADQVTALHTEYEIEHGIPQYDVEFRHGSWEYDYEIHADSGEILSFSKDD